MNIQQFRYGADNLGYLLFGEKTAIAIDGGATSAITDFLKQHGLSLSYVLNTHTHPDHTTGNGPLIQQTGAETIDIQTLVQKGAIELEGTLIRVYHTPGHSADSIVFHFNNILVSGDTLFVGKVGRCFTGDLKGFLASVKRLMALPPETVIYPGHDYVEEYLNTAKTIDPDNPHIDAFLKTYTPDHVYSTLADEFKINPTLRFNAPAIINRLKAEGLPHENEYDRWASVISLVT